MLAPLEDYSDSAFRTLCFRHGADLTFTEMSRVEGIVRRNKPTLAKIQLHDDTPVEIQLLAGREDQLEKYISSFEPKGGFKGFNLNLSCPSPNVMQQGRGCAMVKRVSKTNRLVSIIKKHNYPVSIKLRLGTNFFEKSHKVYLNCLKEVDAEFFVVHAKTGAQESKESADFSVLKECVDITKSRGIPLIANGGIDSNEVIDKLKELGVSGAMIGRPSILNPAIFDKLKGKAVPSIEELKKEYLDLANHFSASTKYRENILKELEKKDQLASSKENEKENY
jgi:tRNA-dihydrouridine synthase